MNLPTRTLRRAVRKVQRAITARRCRALGPGGRLHVGCGTLRLDGWINVDKFPTDATDYVVDVRYGLPFHALGRIFAEHFIEHLAYREIESFFRECRRALADDGILRLSTPNLDWVYRTHYHVDEWTSADEAVRDCFNINKSFRGWGHQFLFNLPALTSMLERAGFQAVESREYGESEHPELRGLERHPRSDDLQNVPHVLVVEASGVRETRSDDSYEVYARDFLSALDAR